MEHIQQYQPRHELLLLGDKKEEWMGGGKYEGTLVGLQGDEPNAIGRGLGGWRGCISRKSLLCSSFALSPSYSDAYEISVWRDRQKRGGRILTPQGHRPAAEEEKGKGAGTLPGTRGERGVRK